MISSLRDVQQDWRNQNIKIDEPNQQKKKKEEKRRRKKGTGPFFRSLFPCVIASEAWHKKKLLFALRDCFVSLAMTNTL